MNSIIKYILKKSYNDRYPLIFKIIKFIIFNLRGKYFSINSLDKKLEKYTNYDNGFYVEIGANDGFNYSNSLYFELNRNWKGILVEPSPSNYLDCKKIRSTNNFIYCNACVSFEYDKKYVDMIYSNAMTVSSNLTLDLKDLNQHLQIGKNFLRKYENNFKFGSLAIPLTTLLKKSNAPKLIDFLSLDVEGAEFEVLKGINFEEYNFKYLLIEARDFEKIHKFLKEKRYEFVENFSEHDFLFRFLRS